MTDPTPLTDAELEADEWLAKLGIEGEHVIRIRFDPHRLQRYIAEVRRLRARITMTVQEVTNSNLTGQRTRLQPSDIVPAAWTADELNVLIWGLKLRAIDKAKILVDQVYDYSGVGSNCHVVIDDYNIGDSSIRWVLDEAIPENLHEATPDQLEIERSLMGLLLGLSESERAKVFGLEWDEDDWRTKP